MEENLGWIKKASEFDVNRFKTLAPLESLKGELQGEKDPRYLMYKIGAMLSPNKSRLYEFLIEYDTYIPSQGIYFGCKSITLPGFNHKEEISQAGEDWKKLKSLVIRRLNNVFISKDFSKRFKITDNANNNTYWPFWISLHEDEDIWEVGIRSLEIIKKIYNILAREGWDVIEISLNKPEADKRIKSVETAFTKSAWNELQLSIYRNVKQSLADNQKGLEERYYKIFINNLEKAISLGLIVNNENYEKALQMDCRFKDSDFNALIKVLFFMTDTETGVKNCRIPWSSLVKIFMRGDETPYRIQVKTLNIKDDRLKFWQNLLIG